MSLKKLQSLAGVTPDGSFGRNTFKACSKYLGITNKNEAVHFWAQVGHETGNFRVFEENLNYSQKGLLKIFKRDFDINNNKRFDNGEIQLAKELARKPELIANFVYANQNGNGDECSGDGWNFRGRGAIQTTGRGNYKRFANYIRDLSIMKNPDLVKSKYCFESAMYFFHRNNLWKKARNGVELNDIKSITKSINGGYNGLKHRVELTNKYKEYEL